MNTLTNCAEKKAKQFLNLLQGYTKGIRFTAILILLLMGVNNAWAFTAHFSLMGDPVGNWNNDRDFMINTGTGTTDEWYIYAYVAKNQYFALNNGNDQYGPSNNGQAIKNGTGGGQGNYNTNSWQFTGTSGIIKICCAESQNREWYPWVWVEESAPTIKFKHPWNGGSWSEQTATKQNDGTYTYDGKYGNNEGFNAGPSGKYKYNASETTVEGSPATGDMCRFIWNPVGYVQGGAEDKASGTFKIVKLCSLTYNGNGNTGGTVPSATNDQLYNTSITLSSTTLTKAGYTHTGWNTKADGTGTHYDKGASYTLTAVSATLYAEWTEKTYSLTFKHDGNGTIQVGGATVNSGSNATVNHVTTKTLVATPNTGYNFSKWTLSGSNTSAVTIGSTTTASTTIKATNTGATVTANFTPITYNITYTAPTNGSYTIKVGDNAAVSANTTANYKTIITLTNTPDPGYRFSKWDITPTVSITNNTTFLMPANDVKIAATFEADTYTITWNANGGSVSPESSSYTYNGDPIVLPQPTRDGYTFLGWFTSANGGDKIKDVGKDNKPTSDVEYFAQWTANTYTVTLNQEEAASKGTESVTATYDAAMPSITLPTAKNGYAFMGYWDNENGNGTSYYNAAGESQRNWDKTNNATLYAYFKKAEITEITLNQNIFDPVPAEGSGSVTATATISPQPEGDVIICWQLLYSNGTVVSGHEPTTSDNAATFSIAGLSAGSYKIKATLRTGTSCGSGDVLHTLEKMFTIASNFTVTVRYLCENEVIATPTKHSGHATNPTEITAQEIGGYNFKEWILGDGITSESNLTSKTIAYKANYDGYLTATYEKKKLIFLDLSTLPNKDAWTTPHIYLYKEDGYWNDNKGTGSKSGGNFITYGAMTQVPGTTDIWYYDYETVQDFGGVVAFTSVEQKDFENFWDCEAIYRADFSSGTPVFVPAAGQIAAVKNESNGKNAKYYNEGYWVRYMGKTGYSLLIYNEVGDTELMRQDFTSENLRMSMTATIDLEANHTYKYEVLRDNGFYYNNDGTLTTSNKGPVKLNSAEKGSIKTTESGNYVFTLDYILDNNKGYLQLSVDYPVALGDYRVLYKDNTRATYKPSQIIKKDETNPIVGYFVRPGEKPQLKVQTATYISNSDVSWSYTNNDEIHFKPNNNWKENGARFAAYFYKDKDNYKWISLTKNGELYSCEKPSGYTHVIFCRMNPAHSTNKWDNDYTWNQTSYMPVPNNGNNLYTLKEGVWNAKVYLKPNSNWTQSNAWFAAYFFGNGEHWVGMTANGDVYECDIPTGYYPNVIFVRMNNEKHDLGWDSKWNQTKNLITPTDGNNLYTVPEGSWDNGDGSWSAKEEYGSWRKVNKGSFTDLTSSLTTKLTEINATADAVYTIYLSANGKSIEKVEPYTGNYYIRVDAVNGKWYDYKTNPDNLMTYSAFSESEANSFGEKFSHYKTKWCEEGINVKFVIANDYSLCISDTLIQDNNNLNNIDEHGNLKIDNQKYKANIRFMWNRKTNEVSRAYVAAAAEESRKFLMLKAENGKMQDKDGNPKEEIMFYDTQNWLYECNIKVKPSTRVKLYACYPDVDESKAQHFRGTYDIPATFKENNSVQILGGSGDTWNTIRVIYDFKTNRLMAAWVPDNQTIAGEKTIDADLMIIRQHQDEATCITLNNDDSKLTNVKTAYGALQFNRWTLNNRGGADDLDVTHSTVLEGSLHKYNEDTTNVYHPILPLGEQKTIYERALYFISFPFDVHLSDVFGFGKYGTHWVISTYNGLRRAQRGYFVEDCINEDCTNWDYIWDPDDFVMKANVGYLLSLDLELMKHDNIDFWTNNISQVELFFPSTAEVNEITKTSHTIPALSEEYLCKINLSTGNNDSDRDRRVKDSYWRCIGVPSYANYDGSLYLSEEDAVNNNPINWKNDYTWNADESSFPFLYEWNTTDNSLQVQNTSQYRFKSSFAYLVQNGKAITWTAVNTGTTPSPLAARKNTAALRDYEWKITLTHEGNQEDQTFLRMTDNEEVTTDFDFNQDLSKEFNYGRSNIYTLVGYERLAANSMPCSDKTTTIPLGLTTEKAGNYTIAMTEGIENIGVTLVDNETGIHTNLSAGQEYTLSLNKGTCENRLFIEVSPIQQSTTDLEYTTEDTREQTTRKMLIDGMLYLIRDGVIYDAQGHRL